MPTNSWSVQAACAPLMQCIAARQADKKSCCLQVLHAPLQAQGLQQQDDLLFYVLQSPYQASNT